MIRKAFLCGVLACACGLPSLLLGADGAPVLMVGDSMMRLLGVAMEKELKAANIQPASSYTSLGSGLARIDAFDWFAKVDSLMGEFKPDTVVVAVGTNDRQTLKDSTDQAVQYGTPEWKVEYGKRIGRIMDGLIKGGAKRVVWLLLPDMKEPVHQEYAIFVNQIIIQESLNESRKEKVFLFDMRPLLTRKPGTFALYVMAPNGAALTVRDADGVHLTKPGAERVAAAIVKTFWKK